MKALRLLLASLCAIVLLTVAVTRAHASTITINFDNLSDNGGGTPIANGYEGFNWNNFNVLNAADVLSYFGTTGYSNGMVSPDNVAYNGDGDPASVLTGNTPFTFNSAYFTGAWNNGLSITISGLLSGVQVETATFVVNSTGPTRETFNWQNVDELDFSSSGGTNAGFQNGGSGTEFAMDNMVLNEPVSTTPEPASVWLMLGGLLALGGLMMRRRALVSLD